MLTVQLGAQAQSSVECRREILDGDLHASLNYGVPNCHGKSSEVQRTLIRLVSGGGELKDNILFSQVKKEKHVLYNFLLLCGSFTHSALNALRGLAQCWGPEIERAPRTSEELPSCLVGKAQSLQDSTDTTTGGLV